MKKWLSHPQVQRLAALAIVAYIRLIRLTVRWDIRVAAETERLWRYGDPHLIAGWHGRLMGAPLLKPRIGPVKAVISHHRDGELIAAVMQDFGMEAIRGSSSKGGGRAARDILTALKQGYAIAITPDGPRGPRMRASRGTAVLAVHAQVPIVPFAFSVSHGALFQSWDRFLLPYPWGRGVVWAGAPIPPGRDADALHTQVETTLTQMMQALDRTLGREMVEPD